MNELNMIASRIEQDIQMQVAQHSDYKNKVKPNYQHSSGRRLSLEEILEVGIDDALIAGAIKISYSESNLMAVDRIIKMGSEFSRKRRMIFKLDTKSGQISAALLLGILKLEDGTKFNKYDLIEEIATEYYSKNGIHISSSEINETYSRMMRKTFVDFFKIEGRRFIKHHFLLKVEQIVFSGPYNYNRLKHKMNNSTKLLIRKLNQQYC